MPRKPKAPSVGTAAVDGDRVLVVKDSLREVRFNVKHGARMLIHAVEAATHRPSAAAHGPLSLLGEPLNLAVRTTATLLSNVDHAAVDLLTADGQHRTMKVPLRSSASYFHAPQGTTDLRGFTTDHHWRLRHWLAMNAFDDVFVREHEVAVAAAEIDGRTVAIAMPGAAQGMPVDEAANRYATAAFVIQALTKQPVLSRPAKAADAGDLHALGALGAVVVVLAGEIAGQLRHLGLREQYAGALRLADEVANADRAGWEHALRSPSPLPALARWLGFVTSHI